MPMIPKNFSGLIRIPERKESGSRPVPSFADRFCETYDNMEQRH